MDRGRALARQDGVDFAVLDINIAGVRSFPIADILRARRIPFIFCSAYRLDDLKDSGGNEIILRKPFQRQELQRAILRALQDQY
jgi:CheY-like chemotaxis protein